MRFFWGLAVIAAGLWFASQQVPALTVAAGQGGNAGNLNQKQVVLVTGQKQVWIGCRAAQANQSLPPGFCDRLVADFTKTTGQAVVGSAAVPEGIAGVMVEVDQTSGQRAGITLILGRGEAGAFVEQSRQEMRLGSADAPLQAGSAQALIYPMAGLLGLVK